jgi:hypothetical protein
MRLSVWHGSAEYCIVSTVTDLFRYGSGKFSNVRHTHQIWASFRKWLQDESTKCILIHTSKTDITGGVMCLPQVWQYGWWQETILMVCNETAWKIRSVDWNIVVNIEVTFITVRTTIYFDLSQGGRVTGWSHLDRIWHSVKCTWGTLFHRSWLWYWSLPWWLQKLGRYFG